MRARRPSAPRAGAATACVAVACCALVGRSLSVLLRDGARGSRSGLPYAALTAESPLATATALVRDVAGRSPAWIAAAAPLTEGAHPSGAMLLLPYVAVVPIGTTAATGSAWAAVDTLPPLAGRDAAAVTAAVATLRDRMDLAPVAFRMLPDRFTLSELQAVYEHLLGRRLHKASFRRALAGAALVEATEDWRSEGRGRPAQLYRYAPRRRRGNRRPVRFELLG
jgi:ADP-ribose pyrophosphatase YjhB (NUDIX family)